MQQKFYYFVTFFLDIAVFCSYYLKTVKNNKKQQLRKHSKLKGHLSEAIKLYRRGKSLDEIADIFGLYASNIYRIFKRRGIKLRNKSKARLNAFKTGRVRRLFGKNNPMYRG
jgi:predicted HTH domain antitoxin